MTRVKICGVTTRENLGAVVEAGADAIGVTVDVPVETPREIDAERAAADGIVSEALPNEELSERVDSFAETIASKPPLAVRSSLDIVEAYGHEPPAQLERREDQRLRQSEDYREAVAAFREDREPEFDGR